MGEEELDALDVVQLRREVQRRLLALRTAGRERVRRIHTYTSSSRWERRREGAHCASLVDVAALLRHEMLHALGFARVQCLEELGGGHRCQCRAQRDEGLSRELKLLGSQCLARRSVSRGPHVQTVRASTPH